MHGFIYFIEILNLCIYFTVNMYILKTFVRGRERFGMSLPTSELSGIYGREVVSDS